MTAKLRQYSSQPLVNNRQCTHGCIGQFKARRLALEIGTFGNHTLANIEQPRFAFRNNKALTGGFRTDHGFDVRGCNVAHVAHRKNDFGRSRIATLSHQAHQLVRR